ncbi:MAG: glycosyltransferase involved in cell wall biosynthesis [Candidatus Azotimanducaceae bacterium]|jgi:glycosyltransferase involved in cell wall biosynthesis
MKIILNFLPLKTGGGVQVALDFLRQAELYGLDHEWHLVAREGTPFESFAGSSYIESITLVPDNIISRLKFELFDCVSLIKKVDPNVIYTQFGPHWLASRGVKNVVGCAYSNLFYPELDFWEGLPWFSRLYKKFIDKLRLSRILAADVRIFETKDLADRAREQHDLDAGGVCYVRATVSSLVTERSTHDETRKRCEDLPVGYKILLLSGYHPNKNIEFLVNTVSTMKRKGILGIKFVLTLPEANAGTQEILRKVQDLGVAAYIYNMGPIPQAGCCEVYRHCDAAILPSTLESFSNMIAESWEMKKPLFISDLSWGRSLCGAGAIYYKFLDSNSLIEKIVALKADEKLQENVINEGRKRLGEYPSPQERFLSYLSIIEASV